jgi:hypothetical protein
VQRIFRPAGFPQEPAKLRGRKGPRGPVLGRIFKAFQAPGRVFPDQAGGLGPVKEGLKGRKPPVGRGRPYPAGKGPPVGGDVLERDGRRGKAPGPKEPAKIVKVFKVAFYGLWGAAPAGKLGGKAGR